MKKILTIIALLALSVFAQDSLTLKPVAVQPKATLSKALKMLDVTLAALSKPTELQPYTLATVDPVTGNLVKVLVTPTVVAEAEGRTSTAMLMK